MASTFNNPIGLCIGPDSSIHQAIARMESRRIGIVLVTDPDRKLLGTITDGDIRRAVLSEIDLDQPIHDLLKFKNQDLPSAPITALAGTDRNEIIRIIREHRIRHLPLVDGERRVVDLVTIENFVSGCAESIQAVIMAGGAGTRLLPLTDNVPKPMLHVNGRPVLELIVQQLRETGIKQISVAVHHKSEKITEHFGDGKDFGVEITYVNEDLPLGTAGALALMKPPKETVLVINGDILTHVDLRAMLDYHKENQADFTMAVQRYEIQVPYGVVELDGTRVKELKEKPLLKSLVNAGIYLLEPSVYHLIPAGERSDMTDLIQRLVETRRFVAAFPVREYWTDIGDHADYEQAQEHFRTPGLSQ
jgi:dTDP-glucose pyrophosphorylase/CBS domain-containing protein